jgi:pyruvate dehydrogenase E1 component beta subunit
MSNGQFSFPLVIYTQSGGGLHFGAQHDQAPENWAMAVPGLKVASPSSPADMKGLMAAAIRDPDPVLVFAQKALYPVRGEVPEGEHVVPLGRAARLTDGDDATIVALGAMVPRALAAADLLAADDIRVAVLDLRTLVPLDVTSILAEVQRTGWLFTVEENPRLCGWGAEVASIVAEEGIDDLDGPIVRITTPHVPLPAADNLEDAALPSPERIADRVRRTLR